jgi:phage I-like protein
MIVPPTGPFTLDEVAARLVMEEWETHKNDMVIVYEHQTFADPPVEAPAAGWIKGLVNKGADGIWAAIEWTERAREYIANREYRYVSPVFLKRKSDNRVIRLVNVALTNQPNIDGMAPLFNKAVPEKEEPMKELWKILGLAETATEADAIAAVNKLREAGSGRLMVVASKAVLDALGLNEGASESEVTGTIMAMKQGSVQVTDLTNQVRALTEKLAGMETADLVTLAVNDGKITPAQKEWAEAYAKRDPEGFKVFLAKAPVVVIQGKVVPPEKPGGGGIDDTQAQINKMCGVDAETFKQYGPKDE